MRVRGSMTVFAAVSFWLIASFLFALLEKARVDYLEIYAAMNAELALGSVCAEYQPALWEKYGLLGLDGAYGGEQFSMEYVTAVLNRRIQSNLELEGDGSRLMELNYTTAAPEEYELLTDGEGSVFLKYAAECMTTQIPAEIAQAFYGQYATGNAVQQSYSIEACVEQAQSALEEAGRQAAEEAVQQESQNEVSPEVLQENPIELAMAWKDNTLLGMVTDVEELSNKQISLINTLENRECQQGNCEQTSTVGWYNKILALEYLENYFSDYVELAEGALSYEMEYVLCGKASDRENLEGTVERLLLVREAANMAHILMDTQKQAAVLETATLLVGFTGNPMIIEAAKLGVAGAWAYAESILDIRTLMRGGRIGLMKNATQWTSELGNLAEIISGELGAMDCEDGLRYQDYVKGFLFLMEEKELAYRMMDVIEQNIRLVPAYENCRMDSILSRISYTMIYEADSLFAQFVTLGELEDGSWRFEKRQEFSYY